jgi:hypothetical protein
MFTTPQRKAPFLTAVLFGLFAFLAVAPAGRANSSYTFNLDCTTASMSSCLTSNSYGTVTVSNYTANIPVGQVEVTVKLAATDEFETNGPDPTIAFNIKNVAVNNITGITDVPSGGLNANGFSTIAGAPFTISSPSFGTFTNGIECESATLCGGTLGDQVSFLVTGGTSLVAADFLPNANNFVFAANVGPSSGSSYIAAVPEPQWYGALVLAGLVALKVTRNRSLKTNQVQA